VHRFFVPPSSLQNGELILTERLAHQVRDVLRLHPGEVIAALDNSGAEYRVELTTVTRREVRGRVLGKIAEQESRERHTRIILYQSLLKADKFEWVLQKGTELGIATFVPIVTERTVAVAVSKTKRARWEQIIVEATEQAGGSKVPPLAAVQSFADALIDATARAGLALIPWEEERAHDLHTVLAAHPGASPISLFIGPEGGFTPSEIEQARARGVEPVTLGSRILRAETAGLVTASAIFFERGDLNA